MNQETHPPQPPEGQLGKFWDSKVEKLASLPVREISPEEAERYMLFSRLLMALVSHYWNGNKRGKEGEYPWRSKQKSSDGTYIGGDYLGHNIAGFAVDGKGEIIDFDFNHNEILNSSVEHAESRLIRRVFSLTQIYDNWSTGNEQPQVAQTSYSNVLNEVSVFTSLESCSQCSGIMALGSLKEVTFLQRDPGQNSIGNILRNLSPVDSRYMPPLPIPADTFGLEHFEALHQGYLRFAAEVTTTPFFISKGGVKDNSASITSFLCTDQAMEIFDQGRQQFEATAKAAFPNYRPTGTDGKEIPGALTNNEVIVHARRFLAYAVARGRRGTPHNL